MALLASKVIFPAVFLLGILFSIQGINAKPSSAELNTPAQNATASQSIPSTNSSEAVTVTIYTYSNFNGIPWTLAITECTDVPGFFYKKASSINTHDGCVILYNLQNCTGNQLKIEPGTDGHSHLSEVNFDDTLASLGPCEHQPTKSNHTASSKRARRDIGEMSEFFKNFIEKFGLFNFDEGSLDSQQEH